MRVKAPLELVPRLDGEFLYVNYSSLMWLTLETRAVPGVEYLHCVEIAISF